MKGIILKLAFATQDEYFCGPDEVRESFVKVAEFHTADYTSIAELESAIDRLSSEARAECGRYLHTVYLNITPCPNGPFFPTGGIDWTKRAWQFHEYLNGKPAQGDLKHGDLVRLTNAVGYELTRNVFGFDKDGEAVLDWDCWWVTKPVEQLQIVSAA